MDFAHLLYCPSLSKISLVELLWERYAELINSVKVYCSIMYSFIVFLPVLFVAIIHNHLLEINQIFLYMYRGSNMIIFQKNYLIQLKKILRLLV